VLAAGVVAVVVIFLLAVSGAPSAADAATRAVKVGNDFFSPTNKSIARGRSVTWVWAGGTPHDVVAKNRTGKIVFRSKITKQRGYTYSHRFSRNGTYKIICSIHPDTMRMTVRVS
jgi:plastocyanin